MTGWSLGSAAAARRKGYQDTVADASRILLRYGDGGWPNLVDPSGTVAIDYGVSGVPESFFIDALGIVRFKQWGRGDRGVDRNTRPATAEPRTHADAEKRAGAPWRPSLLPVM